jgi:hypothetical protein
LFISSFVVLLQGEFKKYKGTIVLEVAAEILHYLLEIANHFSTLFTRVPSSLAEHF